MWHLYIILDWMNQIQWKYKKLCLYLPLHSMSPYNYIQKYVVFLKNLNNIQKTYSTHHSLCHCFQIQANMFSLSHRFIYLKTTFTTKRMFRAARGGSRPLDRRVSSSTASQTGCMRVSEQLLRRTTWHNGSSSRTDRRHQMSITESNFL